MSDFINITPGPLTAFRLTIEDGTELTQEHLNKLAGNMDFQEERSNTPENLQTYQTVGFTGTEKQNPESATWLDQFINCSMDATGLSAIVGTVGAAGAALSYVGHPIPKEGNVSKPNSMGQGGAKKTTNRLSLYTHRINQIPPSERKIHQRFLRKTIGGNAGRILQRTIGTPVVGRLIGRCCGPIGWVLLAADAVAVANCAVRADEWLRQTWINTVEDAIGDLHYMDQYFIRGILTNRWVL